MAINIKFLMQRLSLQVHLRKHTILNRFGKYSIKPVDIVTANMHVNVNIIKSLLNVISLSINILYPVTYI